MGNSQPFSPVSKEDVSAEKQPKAVVKVEGSFEKYPSWRFSRADLDHPRWSVLDPHEDLLTDDNYPGGAKIVHVFSKSIDRTFLDELTTREQMLWKAILTQNGGRGKSGGTNSHNILIGNLAKEAQNRITELGIDTDYVMSVRIDGKRRVFGILESGVMDVIWFDRNHEICPVQRK